MKSFEEYYSDKNVSEFFHNDEVIAESYYNFLVNKNYKDAGLLIKDVIYSSLFESLTYISNIELCTYFSETYNLDPRLISNLSKEDFSNIITNQVVQLSDIVNVDMDLKEDNILKLITARFYELMQSLKAQDKRSEIDIIIKDLTSSDIFCINKCIINYINFRILNQIKENIEVDNRFKLKEKIELFLENNQYDFELIIKDFAKLYYTIFIDKKILTLNSFNLETIEDFNNLLNFIGTELELNYFKDILNP